MTKEQDDHIMGLIKETSIRMYRKYRAGAAEHGGTLWMMLPPDLLENAINEAIDQVIYLQTLKEVGMGKNDPNRYRAILRDPNAGPDSRPRQYIGPSKEDCKKWAKGVLSSKTQPAEVDILESKEEVVSTFALGIDGEVYESYASE